MCVRTSTIVVVWYHRIPSTTVGYEMQEILFLPAAFLARRSFLRPVCRLRLHGIPCLSTHLVFSCIHTFLHCFYPLWLHRIFLQFMMQTLNIHCVMAFWFWVYFDQQKVVLCVHVSFTERVHIHYLLLNSAQNWKDSLHEGVREDPWRPLLMELDVPASVFCACVLY